jgi:hypothetical protein
MDGDARVPEEVRRNKDSFFSFGITSQPTCILKFPCSAAAAFTHCPTHLAASSSQSQFLIPTHLAANSIRSQFLSPTHLAASPSQSQFLSQLQSRHGTLVRLRFLSFFKGSLLTNSNKILKREILTTVVRQLE